MINLTSTPAVREQDPRWDTIAFAYKPKQGSQYDIPLLDWKTRKIRKLTNEQQSRYSWNAAAWSSDDRR